MSIKSYK